MRFKPDENFPVEVADLFRAAGHDAATALDRNLKGTRDSALAPVCRREGRAFVTLDTDFADIRAYPPDAYPVLLVLRPSARSRDRILIPGTRLVNVLPGATLGVSSGSSKTRGFECGSDTKRTGEEAFETFI